MILRPLCTSDDLGDAIAFAKARYRSLSDGQRPLTHNIPFKSTADLFIIRVILGMTKNSDQVQILKPPMPQVITFWIANEWNVGGLGTIPFYGPGASDPHIEGGLVPADTGTLIVIGKVAGTPFVLISTDPSVCSISDLPVTFAEAYAMAVDTSLLEGYTADNCTVTGFTLTVNGYGRTKFYLDRPAVTGYTKLGTMYGGEHIFRHADGGSITEMYSTGGLVFGGQANVISNGHQFFQSTGGLCLGGAAVFMVEKTLRSVGGLVLAGRAWIERSLPLKPTVPAPWTVTIPYAERYGKQITLYGTAVRGGVITFRIPELGANCTVTNTGIFYGSGAWYGTTTFKYIAIETKNGIAVESAPVQVTVVVDVPLTSPWGENILVTKNFAEQTEIRIDLAGKGHATMGGTLAYSAGSPGYGIASLYMESATVVRVSMTGTYAGTAFFSYMVTETSAHDTFTSLPAFVGVTINPPACPQADFTIAYNPDDKVGSVWTFTSTTPPALDGSALTYAWAVIGKPAASVAAYLTSAAGLTTALMPDVAGSYTVQLTVTDAYGSTSVKTSSPTAVALILPPTALSSSTPRTYIQAVVNFTEVYMTGTAKRGGVLTYQVLSFSGGDYGKGANYITFRVASAGTYTLRYTATEKTADNVSATSEVATITIYVAAQVITAMTYAMENVYVTGTNLWGRDAIISGGDGVHGAVQMIGQSNGLGFAWVPGYNVVAPQATGGGDHNGTGYVRVYDGSGRFVDIPFSAFNIPPYSTASWHWELQWTSPAGDIRNYQYFNSYVTVDKDGNWVSPFGIAQIEYESLNGQQWKVVGNYFKPGQGGAPVPYFWSDLSILQDTVNPYYGPAGYIKLPMSVAYFTVIQGGDYDGQAGTFEWFYVHKLFKWVYS